MEEKSSLLSDLLAIGAGIFFGFMILDFFKSRKNSEEDGEYIVTSKGTKLYVFNANVEAISTQKV